MNGALSDLNTTMSGMNGTMEYFEQTLELFNTTLTRIDELAPGWPPWWTGSRRSSGASNASWGSARR